MSTFKLTIASPDGSIFSGEAASISVRGTEGDLCVMAGHIPFITAVKPCDCVVVLPDGSERRGKTQGGILTVSEQGTTLMSGSYTWDK